MKTTHNVLGVSFVILALFTFSLQDITVKWLGGQYPILEMVMLRSLIALPCTLPLFYLEGGRRFPTTRQPALEYLRGAFLFLSFTTYMMGLAALPLADMAAIRNSAPLMVTLFSAVWLGERVGARHWLALVVGFVGVLLIVGVGTGTFNLGSIFVLLSTVLYALSVILTRQMQKTESGATMAYYSSLVYLVATGLLIPPSLWIGDIPHAHPSIAFLFRPWVMPSLLHATVMAGLGLIWALGMYFVARAYSVAQASVVAPFEYLALLINVMWGFVLWQQFPTLPTWAGALLALLSGFYILYAQRKIPLVKAKEISVSHSD